MAEDILHDEITEGDTVIITHDGESEELSFEVQKGEAPTEEPTTETNGSPNGEPEVSPEEVAGGTSTDENGSEGASATAEGD